MKAQIIIIGLAIAIPARADTNFFDILTCSNATYTNATISQVTPSYATVTFAGGIVQISLRELPANLQQQYHYNSNAAAQFISEQKRKSQELRKAAAARQAAYEKATAAQAAQGRNIQVSAIIDETANGGIPLCVAGYGAGGGGGGFDGPEIPSRLLLRNMPAEVKDFFHQYSQLKADIANFESQPIVVKSQSTLYNPDGSIDQYSSQMASQNAAADALYQAKQNKQEALDRMNRRLRELEDSRFDHTTVRAYPTGQTFDGYEIWACVGMSPKN